MKDRLPKLTQDEKEHLYSPLSTKETECAVIILSIKKLLVQKISVVNPFKHAKNRRSLILDKVFRKTKGRQLSYIL